MSSLARFCFKRRWWVLAAWVVLLVITAGVAKSAGSDYSSNFQLPNTQSTQALHLLESKFPSASGSSDQIVWSVSSGTVTDAQVEAHITTMLKKVATLPRVASVTSPYTSVGATQISSDRKVAFATVTFTGQSQNIPKDAVKRVMSVAQAAGNSNVKVALGGNDIENAESQSSDRSTGLGIIFALIVLGLAFGALFAAVVPIITALFAIGVGYSVTTLFSHVFAVNSIAPILGLLIGLGVGVDYALFIVTRFRSSVKSGMSVEDAAAASINTSGRAVFFAGVTVCIALLGQFVLGISFLYGMAVCASVTVLFTMAASLTLLPALLGFFGMRTFSRRQRRILAQKGPEEEHLSGLWYRWGKFVETRPKLPGLVALLAVLAIAAPILTLRLGLDDAASDPPGSTTLAAYTTLARGFGPGFNGPFQLVATLPSPADEAAFASVVRSLDRVPGVAKVGPVTTSPDHTVALALLYPTTAPQAAQTTVLLDHLRHDVLPKATSGTGLTVLVGGVTAIQTDFSHILASKLILFILVVIALGFILLMAVFRSLLVPLIASVMNLLSVGAALGILNAVFEWGWGLSLMSVPDKSPVEVFVPVLLLSILFGLSMDYEVFLVSRMREEWVHTGDAAESITVGQAATGRVITAAAAIMILVFASFALNDSLVVKQFGLGLAGAILVDAFIVRTVLVPAIMHLLGRANWWLPGWLDRAIPHLNVEGADRPGRQPEAEPALAGGGQ